MHICTMLSLAMDNMIDDQENNDFDVTTKKHKEEGTKRKVLDAADRKKIQKEISRHPNQLQMSNTSVLLNIVNGLVAVARRSMFTTQWPSASVWRRNLNAVCLQDSTNPFTQK